MDLEFKPHVKIFRQNALVAEPKHFSLGPEHTQGSSGSARRLSVRGPGDVLIALADPQTQGHLAGSPRLGPLQLLPPPLLETHRV